MSLAPLIAARCLAWEIAYLSAGPPRAGERACLEDATGGDSTYCSQKMLLVPITELQCGCCTLSHGLAAVEGITAGLGSAAGGAGSAQVSPPVLMPHGNQCHVHGVGHGQAGMNENGAASSSCCQLCTSSNAVLEQDGFCRGGSCRSRVRVRCRGLGGVCRSCSWAEPAA